MSKASQQKPVDWQSIRDTVESIWVAIVLAFVLRAFMVEAFVIPTGSMAPRLMGEHQDVLCSSCQRPYAFGFRGVPQSRSREYPVVGAVCPSCRAPFQGRGARVSSGDRVLVLKYRYHFREPDPWDVVVFKNPQDNRQNYIKRLVGLPGEMIELIHGDVFYRAGSDSNEDGRIDKEDFEDLPEYAGWKIRRKGPRAQAAMWQIVFDNDYPPDAEWSRPDWAHPPRWNAGGMRAVEGGRSFRYPGADAPAVLTFQPDNAQVFLPHYGYNSPGIRDGGNINPKTDVCSDLRLSTTFFPDGPDARIALMLSSFDHEFRGELAADGSARLLHRLRGATKWSDDGEWAKAKLDDVPAGKGVRVALVHVDFRVELWVDGKRVLASTDEQYRPDHVSLKERVRQAEDGEVPIPTPTIRIEASGKAGCTLRHIQLHRDVFYTANSTEKLRVPGPRAWLADEQKDLRPGDSPGWGTMDNPIMLRKYAGDGELDEFFMLGDNSPQSLDGRAWTEASPTLRAGYRLGTVPRYSLIGRALFVYWPAGFRLPGLSGLPIVPNVGRMRLIR